MKFVASLFALALFGAALPASAGGFGGPGPFRNGSPLPTGTDGVYNASLRGSNLSGVFRFSISGGTQSGDVTVLPIGTSVLSTGNLTRSNSWVAFYQGNIVRGLTDAAIVETKVSGTLDPLVRSQSQGIVPGNLGGPAVQSAGASLLQGGFFTGSLNQNSPTGSMKGSGQFVVNDLNNIIQTVTTVTTTPPPPPPTTPSTVVTTTATAGTDTSFQGLSTIGFTWRGARVSN